MPFLVIRLPWSLHSPTIGVVEIKSTLSVGAEALDLNMFSPCYFKPAIFATTKFSMSGKLIETDVSAHRQ